MREAQINVRLSTMCKALSPKMGKNLSKATDILDGLHKNTWECWTHAGEGERCWENCARSQGAPHTLKGLRCHCPVCNVSCIVFNKCLCFSYFMAGYFPDRPRIFLFHNSKSHLVDDSKFSVFITSSCTCTEWLALASSAKETLTHMRATWKHKEEGGIVCWV